MHRAGTPCVQLLFQGPKGKYTYKGRGLFAVKRLPSQVSLPSHGGSCHRRRALTVCVHRVAGRSCASAVASA